MTDGTPLRLRWQDRTAEVACGDPWLTSAMTLLFDAFRVEGPRFEAIPAPTSTIIEASLGEQAHSFAGPVEAVRGLESQLSSRLLEGCASLVLHAGAVERNGHVLLLPGPSGAGKTTLTLELVRRGFRFLGDEYVPVESTGNRLSPFPRASIAKRHVSDPPAGDVLALEADGAVLSLVLPERRARLEPVPLLDAGARPDILFPQRRAESKTALHPLGPAEISARILPNTFNFEGRESELWPLLGDLAFRARGWVLEYSEAEPAIDRVLDELGAD